MAAPKEKFATQANPELLKEIRGIAHEEGRQFQAVVEEAFRLYIEQKKSQKPRAVVMANFRASLHKNRKLGELLAQ